MNWTRKPVAVWLENPRLKNHQQRISIILCLHWPLPVVCPAQSQISHRLTGQTIQGTLCLPEIMRCTALHWLKAAVSYSPGAASGIRSCAWPCRIAQDRIVWETGECCGKQNCGSSSEQNSSSVLIIWNWATGVSGKYPHPVLLSELGQQEKIHFSQ